MSTLEVILLLAVLVLVLNVIPVFMPPTWMLLAWFHFNFDIPVVVLAVTGAIAATTGRGLLALLFRRLGTRFLPDRWRQNIEELGHLAEERKAASLAAYAGFLLSPFPSEQLFIAMGIARTPLAVPLVVFLGIRCAGYLIWVTTAGAVKMSLEEVLRPGMGGSVGIVVQVISLLILVGIMQIDWSKWLHRRENA